MLVCLLAGSLLNPQSCSTQPCQFKATIIHTSPCQNKKGMKCVLPCGCCRGVSVGACVASVVRVAGVMSDVSVGVVRTWCGCVTDECQASLFLPLPFPTFLPLFFSSSFLLRPPLFAFPRSPRASRLSFIHLTLAVQTKRTKSVGESPRDDKTQ